MRFVEGVYAFAKEEQELEIQAAKRMTNSADGIQREMKVKGQMLGTVTSFKYLAAVVVDDGFKPKVSQGLHKPLKLLQC